MMNWHFVTSAEYAAGVKVDGDMYFLSDTREIYRGTVPFTESVILYTELPTSGIALNRLYINSTTLEGKIHNGTSWVTVIRPVADTVVVDGAEPVSGKAVAAYVAAEMAKVSTSENVVSSLSWDSAEHLLTVTKGDESKQNILFDGLGCSLQYTAADGKLQLLDASGNPIGDAVSMDLERFVTAGEYDPDTQSIILYFDAEKTESVTIPVGDLVDTYTAESSTTLNLAVEGTVVKGSVKISTADGNLITVDEHGLYVAPIDISGKMDKVAGAVEGNIATLDADGNVVDSGKNFDDLGNNNKLYQGASLDEALAGAIPAKGDFAVISTPIGETGKVQKTAYQYDGENWVAFDSDYDASKIILPEDWLTTTKIGVIQTLTNGQATIAKAGTDVLTALKNMTLKETQPTVTQPAVSFSSSSDNEFKAYEVGDTVAVAVTAALSAGNYQYGRFNADGQFESATSAGVSATGWTFTDSNGVEKTDGGNIADFGTIEVTDGMAYNVTAKATYDASAYTPATNLKNPATVAGIAAGSKSKTTANITGFRRAFWGYKTTAVDPATIDSAFIRGLQNKSDAGVAVGSKFDVSFEAGTRAVIFAYPATIADVSSVIDTGAMQTPIEKAHDKLVDVEGLNGYDAASYKVWIYTFADPGASNANTYAVTI